MAPKEVAPETQPKASVAGRKSTSSASAIGIFLPTLIVLIAIAVFPSVDPELIRVHLDRVRGETPFTEDLEGPLYTRTNIFFGPENAQLEAWLYEPKKPSIANGHRGAPVLVMAHGLGAQRDFGLHRYADMFASTGLAVLVFDYRGFGGSDGEPRHLVDPKMQLGDWSTAINHVLSGKLGSKFERDRVALWGTSYAGGTVLLAAAKHGTNVTAVISQVPYLDGVEGSKNNMKRRGVIGTARALMAAANDMVRSLLGWDSLYIRLAGRENELAVMQLSKEELQSYFSKHPQLRQGGWRNQILARSLLRMLGHNPMASIKEVKCPVLFTVATKDVLCQPEAVHKAVKVLPQGSEVHVYDCTHFDLYAPEHFTPSTTKMLEFLGRNLGVTLESPIQNSSNPQPVHEAAAATPDTTSAADEEDEYEV